MMLVLISALSINTTQVRAASTITVTNTNDSGQGSLRAAVSSAASGDRIEFRLAQPATIALTSGEIVINKSLTIAGPVGQTLIITGNSSSRIFLIPTGVEVIISNLLVRAGSVGDEPGGGIINSGTMTIRDSAIIACSSGSAGGGVANFGRMLAFNSTFYFNEALFAGAIANLGLMSLFNCTLSDNRAT
jgi:hypothetical protein